MTQRQNTATHIAIVGMAGRLPGARTVADYWRNLCDGIESIRQLSTEEMVAAGLDPEQLADPHHVPVGALIDDVDRFDASFFGVSGREAELMDPQQRLFLECAWEALEDAGCDPGRFDGAIGTFGGANFDSYLTRNLLPADVFEDKSATLQAILSNDKDYLATRVAYKLDLRGPAYTVQSGCSTSLLAVHLACHSLLNYECDMALAGGVAIDVGRAEGYWAHEGGVHAPDGHCRAFGADAKGTVFGNGVAVVVLKRLADALEDGDTISAVVIGSAVNNDGAVKVGFTAPSVSGQSAVVAEALADAGVTADTIGYVEAHGTGTPLGDPIEIEALTQAFGRRPPGVPKCAIGSVKSNVGHLDCAAGAAGLIKAALALRHQLLPASLYATSVNPKIPFAASPFVVNQRLTPWTAGTRPGLPRRAGVSSFGMGGTNVHVVLEEPPTAPSDPPNRGPQLLVWSARTPEALELATRRLCDALSADAPAELADVAHTLQAGRSLFAYRRALAVGGLPDARTALADPDGVRIRSHHHDGVLRRVAFLFPGQGSQYAGMCRELYEAEPAFREAFDACARAARSLTGDDLAARVCLASGEAADAALMQTALAQPALFSVEYALARLWMSWGVTPAAMIGHSLGEFVAACLAGVFSLSDAIRLVVVRGRLMQDLPEGAMTAVAADADALALDGALGVAALNGTGSTVVSGPLDEIARFEMSLTARGIAWRRLRTSHAFHSPMVAPAMQPFAEAFDGVRLSAPTIPFVSNVTGRWIEVAEATSPYYWAEHLRQPVRFAQGVRCLLNDGVYDLLEVGPGRTLTSLARQAKGDAPIQVVASLAGAAERTPSDVSMLDALGQLWLSGIAPDWSAVHGGRRRLRVALPTYPFERARHWIDRPADDAQPVDVRLKRLDDPARWLYVPGWKQTPSVELVSRGAIDVSTTCWLVFADESAIAQGVVSHLRAEAAGPGNVTVVTVGDGFEPRVGGYAIDPASAGDYDRLIAALGQAGRRPTMVVHLWTVGERPADSSSAARVRRAQDVGAFSLIALTRALEAAQQGGAVSIRVVTRQACDVLGIEPISLAATTLHGVARVIPQELPHVDCGCIDVDTSVGGSPDAEGLAALVTRLVREVSHRVPEPFVAYRGASRWAPSFQALAEPGGRRLLRQGGTYVVLGGLGRIGLTVAEHLARTLRAQLVLVGRTPVPEHDDWASYMRAHGETDPVTQRLQRVLDIEALGGGVLVLTADAADPVALEAVFAAAERRFGRVHGVISAAGIVSGAFHAVTSLTADECERQFRPKVDGLFALEQVLASRPPDFCLLVSSLSSILGGLGYGAYAAANVFMDAFTRARNRQAAYPWISVNWDAWRWTAVDPKAAGASLARLAMLPDEAMRVFDAVVARAGTVDQLVISTTDLSARVAQWVNDIGARQTSASRAAAPPADAAGGVTGTTAAPVDDRSLTPTQRVVVEVWADVLKLPRVELTDGFLDIGGSSLAAVHAISRLGSALGVHVAIEEFIFQTAGQLAGLCDRKLAQMGRNMVTGPR